MTQPLLSLRSVSKTFASGTRQVRAVDDVSFDVQRRRVPGDRRRIRFRQVDHRQYDPRHLPADAGRDRLARQRAAGAPRPRASPRHPARAAESAVITQPETQHRRIAAPGAGRPRHRREIRSRRAHRAAAPGGRPARRFPHALAGLAVRRPAPARRDRARAGLPVGAGRARRADLGARRAGPGARAETARRAAPQARPDLHLHHPRSVGGPQHRRPRRRVRERQARRARPDGNRFRQSEPTPTRAG